MSWPAHLIGSLIWKSILLGFFFLVMHLICTMSVDKSTAAQTHLTVYFLEINCRYREQLLTVL